MFKHIKLSEQLRQAQGEVNRLKSIVGEFPNQEEMETEQKTLVKEVEQKQADIDYIAIMTEVEL